MIELIEGLPRNVVGIFVRGRVTRQECRDVLVPAIERSLKRHDKIRLYYELGSRFPGAAWEDLDIGIEHASRCERVAIVTDIAWVRLTVKAIRFLIPGEIRVFATIEAEEGRAWITARPRPRQDPEPIAATPHPRPPGAALAAAGSDACPGRRRHVTLLRGSFRPGDGMRRSFAPRFGSSLLVAVRRCAAQLNSPRRTSTLRSNSAPMIQAFPILFGKMHVSPSSLDALPAWRSRRRRENSQISETRAQSPRACRRSCRSS